MNRDDIIRMAREAGVEFDDEASTGMYGLSIWERFANLVAAAEREACQRLHDLLEVHQAALEASEKPGPWPAKEVIDKAVAAEREACALVCDDYAGSNSSPSNFADRCAAAIRARGEV